MNCSIEHYKNCTRLYAVMKNKHISLTVLFMTLTLATSSYAQQDWRRLYVSTGNNDVRGATIDIRNDKFIMVMSSAGLFQVNISSPLLSSKRILGEPVNEIFTRGERILAATDRGLFSSNNNGNNWLRENTEAAVYDISAEDDRYLLASDKGIFVRSLDEPVWQRFPGSLGREKVLRLLVSENGFFAMTRHDLYFINADHALGIKAFSLGMGSEDGTDVETEDERTLPAGWENELVDVFMGYEGLYLAARHGIYISQDGGTTWREFRWPGNISGIISSVVSITGEDGREIVCFSSSKGVACGHEGAVKNLYAGMDEIDVVRLSILRERGLIAATRRGVYIIDDVTSTLKNNDPTNYAPQCIFKDYPRIEAEFSFEPSVRQVQVMAVDHAEADKSKIDAWRRQARVKALVPDLSIGVDRASGELLHWDTGSNPDVLQKGRSYSDWDVRLTWKLSDMVWSSDQTAIDSRSKLMVELREQVIDQVTRIYFERRRLQVELSACSYADSGERMAAEMRVAELTALLDGYTGGAFSRLIINDSFNHQPRRDNP